MNMENEMEKDEIVNPEQFQVSRAPEDQKADRAESVDYTGDEIEFADGVGTELDEELDLIDEDDFEGEIPEEPEDDLEEPVDE
jgi:hypothetical protein